jgi:hypothetical protein
VLFAVLTGMVAVGWSAISATRPYRRTAPRYAAGQPLVAQGGVAGRAAVLGAPTTHRALALLELKSALEEGLAQRLGLPPNTGIAGLFEEIERQGRLSGSDLPGAPGVPALVELKRIFDELNRAESAVASARPLRVSRDGVENMRRRVLAILEQVGTAPPTIHRHGEPH